MSLDAMQLESAARADALARANQCIASWNLALPEVSPLVMDFGLDDFSHVGLIEYWIANEIKAGYCGKYMFVFGDQRCPTHRHRDKHETFFVVRGGVEAMLDDRLVTLEPGQTLAIAPGRWHNFRGIGPAMILELSMPCHVDDNEFQDPRINAWLKQALSEGSQ